MPITVDDVIEMIRDDALSPGAEVSLHRGVGQRILVQEPAQQRVFLLGLPVCMLDASAALPTEAQYTAEVRRRRELGETHPSVKILKKHYGTWNYAMRAAAWVFFGDPRQANPQRRLRGGAYTREEVLRAIDACREELRGTRGADWWPSWAEYWEWRALKSVYAAHEGEPLPRIPTWSPVVRWCGSYRQALDALRDGELERHASPALAPYSHHE